MKILNKKQVKELLKESGINKNLDYVFLMQDNKIYITNRETFDFELEKLNIKSVGLLFGEIKNKRLVLSQEAEQLIKGT